MSAGSNTRERILEAAETAFADRGYHDTLVDDIGRAIEISKGGVYFHFPSKEDLFFAVMDRLADRLVARAEKAASAKTDPLSGAEAALEAVLTSICRRRRLARLLLLQGYSMGNAFERKRATTFDRFAGLIRLKLDEAKADGLIDDIDTALVSRMWIGAINEVTLHWLYDGGRSPVDHLPQLRALLTAGLGAGRVRA